jgi:hypothetical protein
MDPPSKSNVNNKTITASEKHINHVNSSFQNMPQTKNQNTSINLKKLLAHTDVQENEKPKTSTDLYKRGKG